MTKLQEQIRESAKVAEEMCMHGDFNAMTWLDLLLEENPESFDCYFDTTWAELSENDRNGRINAIRAAL